MKSFFLSLILIIVALPTAVSAQTVETPAAKPSIAARKIVHPGGWHSAADIQRVRDQLAAQAEPWTGAKEKLMAGGPNFDYKPGAVATVARGGGGSDQGGNSALQRDASNAYTLMIEWVATNDPRYGDAAIRIIDAWSEVLTEIKGSDARLAAAIYGNKFAQAAELAAYYKPDWPNKERAQKMFLHVFYPVIKDGAGANWGTACMAGIISMGVFCDQPAMVDDAIDAYEHGFPTQHTMPAVTQYLDESGECAESGRDQPHPQGGMAHLVETAAVAWNQGINLFPYGNNRLMAGLEYIAKYNLGNDVPYHPFVDYNGKPIYSGGISAKGRGRFSPIYEMAYNYFTLAGMDAPYCKQVLAQPGYSPEGTNNDHPGLGTLMYRPAPGAPQAPIPPGPRSAATPEASPKRARSFSIQVVAFGWPQATGGCPLTCKSK
jgi:hypothetical protein